MPKWFTDKDPNCTGQITMAQYATTWTAQTLAEFNKYDLNRDGIITAEEVLKVEGPAKPAPAATAAVARAPVAGAARVLGAAAPGAPAAPAAGPPGGARRTRNRLRNSSRRTAAVPWPARIRCAPTRGPGRVMFQPGAALRLPPANRCHPSGMIFHPTLRNGTGPLPTNCEKIFGGLAEKSSIGETLRNPWGLMG